MGRGLLVFISIILLNSTAQAQVQCFEVFNLNSKPVNAESIEMDVKTLVENWWSLLEGKLNFPIVDVTLQPENVNKSYFAPGKSEISLGVMRGKEFASHLTRGAVFAHEFAHAIFAENFTFLWKGRRHHLKDVLASAIAEETMISKKPALKELFEEVEEIQQTISIAQKVKDKETETELVGMYLQKKKQLEAELPNLHLYEKIHQLTIAHNELFADSFPALYWKNPRMITEALASSHLNELSLLRQRLLNRGHNKEATSEQRDFEITSFKDWKKELAVEYTLFDPARGALWKLFMQNLKSEEIPLFMKVFLAATSLQINSRLEKLQRNEDIKTPPSDLNREFLRLFVEEARRQGLPIRK